MAHAVAGGVALGGPVRLHPELQDRADSAAEPAVARRARPELMTREEQRKARLRDLDAAELDAAGGLALAGRLPPVTHRRRAAAAPRVEEVPDERALRP